MMVARFKNKSVYAKHGNGIFSVSFCDESSHERFFFHSFFFGAVKMVGPLRGEHISCG